MQLNGPRWGDQADGAEPSWPTAVVVPPRSPAAGTGPVPGSGGTAHGALGASDGHQAQPPSYWWPSPSAVPVSAGTGLAGRASPSGPSDAPGAGGPGRPGWRGKPPGVLRRAWQRVGATLAAVGAFLAKFGALMLKVKYVGLVLYMFVSIVAYSLLFGWSFAVGIVLLVLVHEMGHVIELRRQGVPASAPLFIPFMGAFVSMKGAPRSAFQEALSGLAGPLVGTAASAVVGFWANATGSKFLMALAFFGFFVNLFNLLPVLPLDGGRAVAALHPVLWLLGLVCLVVFEFLFPSPVVLIVVVLGGFELWHRWRNRNSPASRAYHSLLPTQRLTIATIYLFVIGAAIVGAQLTYVARSL